MPNSSARGIIFVPANCYKRNITLIIHSHNYCCCCCWTSAAYFALFTMWMELGIEAGGVGWGGGWCRMTCGEHHVDKLQVVEVQNSFQVGKEYKPELYWIRNFVLEAFLIAHLLRIHLIFWTSCAETYWVCVCLSDPVRPSFVPVKSNG